MEAAILERKRTSSLVYGLFAPKMKGSSSKTPNLCTKIINVFVVAEHSVDRRNFFGKRDGGIRRENADISNDKYCEKQYRRKRKVFYVKIICVELDRTLRMI